MPGLDSVAIHEFGIEPAVLNSWERFSRFFIECCGFGEGRVISEIPDRRDWSNAVLVACQQSGMKQVRLKSVEEWLRRGEDRFFERAPSGGGPYSLWIDAAIAAHQVEPLKLIIAEEENDEPFVETPEELNPDGPWSCVRTGPVKRSAAAIAQLCRKILWQAKKISLVDPYLDVGGPVVRALLPLAWNGRNPSRVHLHVTNRAGEDDHIRDALGPLIPAGETVVVHVWRKESLQADMDRVHDRFLLSELGGVSLGWGFSSEPDSVTQASLLDQESAQAWLARFRPESSAYELERDPPLEIWGTAV